jgi:hypothetical protein
MPSETTPLQMWTLKKARLPEAHRVICKDRSIPAAATDDGMTMISFCWVGLYVEAAHVAGPSESKSVCEGLTTDTLIDSMTAVAGL